MNNTVRVLLAAMCCSAWMEARGEAEVSMRWPQGTLLADEFFRFTVTFTNGTASAAKVIGNPGAALARRQISFSYGTAEPLPSHLVFDGGTVWASVTQAVAMAEVPAGGTYSWRFFGGEMLAVCREYAVTGLVCHLMLGDGMWIRSGQQPVSVIDKGVDDSATPVFNGTYKGRDGKSYTLNVFSVAIGDGTFLFDEGGLRLCQVMAGETPAFALDFEAAVLSITLPSLREPARFDLNVGPP